MENGKLTIYYSTVFPRFATAQAAFQARDASKATSFIERYKIWLAVHAFFLNRDQEALAASRVAEPSVDESVSELREREERCRMAVLSSLFAAREVFQLGQGTLEDD